MIGGRSTINMIEKERRDKLKKSIRQQFPLVPESLVDSCIDIAAQAFTKVATKKLQAALRPGGMDRLRPEIEQVIVGYALEQPAIQKAPLLEKKEKREVVEAIVSVALDYVLKDAREVLAAPEVRLEELEEQLKEIKERMGLRRLVWYRIRHNSKSIMVALTLSAVAMLVYQQRSVPIVAQILTSMTKTLAKISNAIATGATSCYTAVHALSRTATGYLARIKTAIAALMP